MKKSIVDPNSQLTESLVEAVMEMGVAPTTKKSVARRKTVPAVVVEEPAIIQPVPEDIEKALETSPAPEVKMKKARSGKPKVTITVAAFPENGDQEEVNESIEKVVVAPSNEELEERINDVTAEFAQNRKGIGRGFANAGKKYIKTGQREEVFSLKQGEKTIKITKGDKLHFFIGKTEVTGVFSHLNRCIHCPEGYAVIKHEGKPYERRQSRVSIVAKAVLAD